MAFTKVVGAGIHTLSNIASHNINSSGIITATKFVGPMENGSGISTFYDLKVTNNLTVEGTTTTLDTKLVEVDKIEVEADSTNVAIAVTQTGSGDLIRLYDSSTQVVTVDDQGNVGIKKDAPGTSLHVRSTDTGGGNIAYFDDTGSGVTGRLMILTTDGVSTGGVKFQTVNKKYTYFGNATNKLTIDNNNSRVGIVSDIPHRDLSINGSGADIALMGDNAGIYMGNSTGGFQNNCAIARAAASNYHITGSKPGDLCIAGESENDLIFGTSVSDGAMNERFRIGHAGISTFSENVHLTKGSGTSLLKLENTNGTTQLDIRHTNGYGAIHYVHQGTEKWRVGQTAQADHFSVYQSSSVSDGLPYRLFIQNNGEVGINTSDPNDTLHLLRNSANHGIKLQRGGTLPGSALVQVHSNGVLSLQGDNNIHYVSGGSQQHIWYRASTEVARIDTSGRLGIGTDSPSSLLEVASNSPKISLTDTDNNSEVYLHNVGGAAILNAANSDIVFQTPTKELVRFQSTGRVGIGTNGPATLLHLKSSDPTLRIQRYNQSAYGDITADTAGKITFKSDPGNAANGDGFSFTVNNSEKVGISSAGVVDVTGSIIIDDPGGGTGLSINGVSGETCGVVRQRDDVQHAIIFRGSSNADGSTITGGNTTEYREYGDHVFKTGAINQHERFRITQNGQLLHTANKNSG